MINSTALAADLRGVATELAGELQREPAPADGGTDEVRAAYEEARLTGHTSLAWTDWLSGVREEAAAIWVLGTVFVRFCDDNSLLPPPRSGPAPWPTSGSTGCGEPIMKAFSQIRNLDGHLLDQSTLAFKFWPSHRGFQLLAGFWSRRDASGAPVYSFSDPELDTSFLADLYESMSESLRQRYALIRTPPFVVEYILDYTLDPAVASHGLDGIQLVDPACGSGGFLVAALRRLLDAWERELPELTPAQRTEAALKQLVGVDISPFAAEIARFRLLMAAARFGGGHSPDGVSRFHPTVWAADSLLAEEAPIQNGLYTVVVGNPPYSTVVDRARDQRYREVYDSCVGRYPLTVPFIDRFFRLSKRAVGPASPDAGHVGFLVANSFMKREFGRPLATEVLAVDVSLRRIVDTAGAYIPGHGIPTAIIIGRNCPPERDATVFTIVGERGEAAVPSDPGQGLVWQSIAGHAEPVESADGWTRSHWLRQEVLQDFPWNLSGSGVSDLRSRMSAARRLGELAVRVGYHATSGSDGIFVAPTHVFARMANVDGHARTAIRVCTGSEVRDWIAAPHDAAFMPRTGSDLSKVVPIASRPDHLRRLWPYRTTLGRRSNYSGRDYFTDGRCWYDWHHVVRRSPSNFLITFPWVATHNHFVLLHSDLVPLHSAPVIDLPEDLGIDGVLSILAFLNSSAACFLLKQTSHSKGQPNPYQTGAAEPWADHYEFTASRVAELPIPERSFAALGGEINQLAQTVASARPEAVLAEVSSRFREALGAAEIRWRRARARMVALQEELDWCAYGAYELLPADDSVLLSPDPPPLKPGERAFEIVLARRMQKGDLSTTWFSKHGATPVTELPRRWSREYREVVERRIAAIERDPTLEKLERPSYKRRWATPDWQSMQKRALHDWLVGRCASKPLWYVGTGGGERPRPLTIEELTRLLETDESIVEAAELYMPGETLEKIVRALVDGAHVPCVAGARYRESGMGKYAEWEEVWALQDSEDAARARGDEATAGKIRDRIPTPPRYVGADFRRSSYWRLRGKYDVPNEQLLSYPVGDRAGAWKGMVLGWAGWTVVERAQVLADLVTGEQEPGSHGSDLSVGLLAGVRELLPWLRRGTSQEALARERQLSDLYYECLGRLGRSDRDVAAWRLPASPRGRPRRRT